MKRALLIAAVALLWTARTSRADTTPPDYAPVDFNTLSDFPFDLPDIPFGQKPDLRKLRPKIRSMIPQSIRSLDGKNVSVTGFMMPLDDDNNGGTRKFILMRNQITCCFGGANRINEYVMVTMGSKSAPFVPNVPVKVEGTLAVGPQFEDGVLNGIYQMVGNEVRP
jgi:hypothetical protein